MRGPWLADLIRERPDTYRGVSKQLAAVGLGWGDVSEVSVLPDSNILSVPEPSAALRLASFQAFASGVLAALEAFHPIAEPNVSEHAADFAARLQETFGLSAAQSQSQLQRLVRQLAEARQR